MSQDIQNISVEKLVLWSENPRDPIQPDSTAQEIANRSISADGRSKWSLKNLFKSMGAHFDQSELPTVAYVQNKPVVYDGNRRVLIGKIIHGYVIVDEDFNFSGFDFPKIIPCNVCDLQTALEHVDRKHADSGSWRPLERDIFKHVHMKEKKSPFLIIDENTKIISNNPEMNKRFVKDEIFEPTRLHQMGISIENESLKTNFVENADAYNIFDEVVRLVGEGEISTRKNRGKIIDLLQEKGLLQKKQGDWREFKGGRQDNKLRLSPRKTRIGKGKNHRLFGEQLRLKHGSVNNLYSDLKKIYDERTKKGYSQDLPMILRIGLRLIVEIAANDDKKQKNMGEYIGNYFQQAKNNLTKDEATTLSTQQVEQNSMEKLLQIGAHGYTASNNLEQTVALSLIIGKILERSHGR